MRKFIPNFNLDEVETFLVREGIPIEPNDDQLAEVFHFKRPGGPQSPYHDDGPPMDTKAYPYPPQMMPPGYPMALPPGYPPPPPGAPYPPMGLPPPGMYNPHIHPAFQHPAHVVHLPPPMRPGADDIKGQDPQANDLSNPQALAKNFGVSEHIVNEAGGIAPDRINDVEDLAVGSGGLLSGRDRDLAEASPPRDGKHWTSVVLSRTIGVGTEARSENVVVWLPKDRHMTMHIVQLYFAKLNVHRPVLVREEFIRSLDALYDQRQIEYDPGLVFNIYLVLALGTMSEENKAAGAAFEDPSSPHSDKFPPGWPHHEDFFKHALPFKPDLRMTISSLQALILLHWYLYCEV